jgi:probable HAF family extracellular repeat protein
MTDLGTLGGRSSWAQGINDDGEIMGWSETADGETHGVLWRKRRMLDLGLLEGRQTVAYAINEKGVKVGFATGGDAGPVVWRNRKARRLPTLGLFGGDATAINELGQIVGSSLERPGEPHAVLWRLE